LAQWPSLQESNLLETIFPDALERRYWSSIWQRIYERPDLARTWAYQWTFACLVNGGLTALPNKNLVSNIGFDVDGTHTYCSSHSTHDQSSAPLGKLIAPSFAIRDNVADKYTFSTHFLGVADASLGYYFIRAKSRARSLLSAISASRFWLR
jgi:hypothetical protein